MNDSRLLVRFRDDAPLLIGDVSADLTADANLLAEFREQVISRVGAASESGPVALLLDFKQVNYMSSLALSELIRIRETLQGKGGVLRLCGLSPDAYTVFTLTKLDDEFSVRSGEDIEISAARLKQDLALSPSLKPLGSTDGGAR
jgi:anti-anti-sigma factor